MAATYRVLSHTADTGIEVRADSWGELIECAALGMCALVYDLDLVEGERSLDVRVEAGDRADLLVDVLSEVLYLSEAQDVVPLRFTARHASATGVELEVAVAPVDDSAVIGAPIKAVTYHGLTVDRTAAGVWEARVVFDV